MSSFNLSAESGTCVVFQLLKFHFTKMVDSQILSCPSTLEMISGCFQKCENFKLNSRSDLRMKIKGATGS